MLIYTCSSSHGYGHAARDAALLQQLRRLQPDWTLVMSSGLPTSVLNLLLGDPSIQQRPCQWDVGMVQADALGVNQAATLTALDALEQQLPVLIEEEARWLESQEQPVLILADIPPAATALAQRLNAPLVWMSNFGWDDIYAPLGPAFQGAAESAAEAYRSGDLLLRCPFDLAMNWGLPERRLGLVCAMPRTVPRDLEATLVLSMFRWFWWASAASACPSALICSSSGLTTIFCFPVLPMRRPHWRVRGCPTSRC